MQTTHFFFPSYARKSAVTIIGISGYSTLLIHGPGPLLHKSARRVANWARRRWGKRASTGFVQSESHHLPTATILLPVCLSYHLPGKSG
jgi:hypothetical protein